MAAPKPTLEDLREQDRRAYDELASAKEAVKAAKAAYSAACRRCKAAEDRWVKIGEALRAAREGK